MRKSTLFLLFLSIGCLSIALTAVDAVDQQHSATQPLQARTALVGRLGISDLALFTEARYTRHVTQADRHAAFQDHPSSLDHFPSGSLISPPPRLLR
ncbi:MAG: hypothetical protein RPU52_16120 [Candidatus Sedimenticola sp. (ex Thyasira tokunagai)]